MTTVKDPVCGMTFEQGDAEATSAYNARTYFFCSRNCKETFDSDPVSYA